MNFDLSVFSTVDAWVALLTLTFLELVLGIDNIIFISITASKLPAQQQQRARNYGLTMAMVVRLILLALLSWIMGLTETLFTLPLETIFRAIKVEHVEEAIAISGKDLILIIGGFFLLAKSTSEIHGKVTGEEHTHEGRKHYNAFFSVLMQIVLIDIVFSFDSILTAVGLTAYVPVMMTAVILSMLLMMFFSQYISDFIQKYPTLQMLALSFLIMIGLTLVAEGFGVHINKAFVYISVIFSLGVEFLNIRMRKKGA